MSTKDGQTKGTTQSVDKTAAAATEDEIAKRLSERVTAAYGPMRQSGNTGHQVANLVSLIGTSQNPEKWDLPTFSSIVWYRNKVEPGGWVGDKWQESKIHYGGHDKDIIEFFSALKSRRMHTMRKTGYESARVTLPPLPVEPTQSDPVQTDTAPSEPVQSASTSSAPNQELFPALFPQSSVDQPDAKTMSERWKIAMDADSQITTSNKEESSNSDSQGAA